MSILRPYHLNPGNERALFKLSENEFCKSGLRFHSLLDYADVFLQREGQDEDLMSEAHVRTGFVFPALLKVFNDFKKDIND